MATKKDETITPSAIAVSIENTEAIAPSSEPVGGSVKKYSTDLLRHLGFNVCDKCGAQFQNDIDGRPICPEQEKECPRLK